MQRPDHGQAVAGLASDLSTGGRLLTGAPRLAAELPLGWRRRGRGVVRPQPSSLPSSPPQSASPDPTLDDGDPLWPPNSSNCLGAMNIASFVASGSERPRGGRNCREGGNLCGPSLTSYSTFAPSARRSEAP